MNRSSPFAEGLGPAAVYYLFRVAAWLAEHIPVRAGDRLARGGGALWHRLSTRKRRIVDRNLMRVVRGGEDLSKAAFHSYAEYWLETFRLGRYSKEKLLEMVTPDAGTVEAVEDALAEGKGLVLATGHIGFYDLGVAWVGARGWPFNTVAEVLRPRALFEWFAEIREKNGMHVIPAKPGSEARARLIELVGKGEGVALLADRDLSRKGLWAEFFSEPTTFPAGPALVVAETGAPLLAGAIYKDGPERFTVHFERVPYELTGRLQEDLENLAALIASRLEVLVRRSPEQWHMFNTNWPSDEPHLPPRGRPS